MTSEMCSNEGGLTLANDDMMMRLRTLVAALQSSATYDNVKDANQEGKLQAIGFDDGQIQAGNELERILDDLSGVERRPDT